MLPARSLFRDSNLFLSGMLSLFYEIPSNPACNRKFVFEARQFPAGYWMMIFFCCVLTPPCAVCAVTVITASPVGNGGVK